MTRRLVMPVQWLISPAADLWWLIGTVSVSWLLFALWSTKVLTTAQVTLLWIFGIHGPHFWATISRTFLDPTERAQRGAVLRRSLLWFLVGPVIVGAGLVLQDATGKKDLVLLFFFFAALWAYHHVVKQHFGFMALYRVKAREFGKAEFAWHRWYLVLSLWAPAAIVLSNSAPWLIQIPLVEADARAHGPERILALGQHIQTGATWLFWGLQVAFAASLAWRVASGRGINLPETLIVVAAVPMHWFVTRAALTVADPIDAIAFVPLVTTYHNLQYHGLVWHYNRTKYHAPGAEQRFGLAATVNRNLVLYLALGFLYAGATIGIEYYGVPVFEPPRAALGIVLGAAIWGFSFLHYYLDGHIWRVRHDPALRKVLGFPEPPAAAGSA